VNVYYTPAGAYHHWVPVGIPVVLGMNWQLVPALAAEPACLPTHSPYFHPNPAQEATTPQFPLFEDWWVQVFSVVDTA